MIARLGSDLECPRQCRLPGRMSEKGKVRKCAPVEVCASPV